MEQSSPAISNFRYFSIYKVFSAAFSVLGGWSLDQFGPKWTVAMMGFFTASGLFLTSQMYYVWQLYVTYGFLLGIGMDETYTVVAAFVSRWFHEKRGLALGIVNSGGGLGTLIMAPLATYLIVNFDWRTTYVAIGVIALVIVIGLAQITYDALCELAELLLNDPLWSEKIAVKNLKVNRLVSYPLS